MPHMRRYVPSLVLFVGLFLSMIAVNAACSGSQRQKTLHASVLAVNTARDALLVYDKDHQADLVDHATSHEDGEAKLAAYHAKRAVVVTAFEVAYRALAVAATANDDPSYQGALAAATAAVQAYHELTGGK